MITNSNLLVLDIETYKDVPKLLAEKRIEKMQPRKGTKDIEKIKAQLQAKIDAIEEKAALSPLTGRVICVGLCWRDIPETEWASNVIIDADESVLLKCALEEIDRINPCRIITYCGSGFDIPFLAARCALHQIKGEFRWPMGKYHPLHVDLFEVLEKEGSLEDWAILFTGAGKMSGGSDIAEMWEKGKTQEIVDHCRQDVELTALLYDRLSSVAELTRR